jgi:two-component system phosphate regulon sensor histidine kinase PhoR
MAQGEETQRFAGEIRKSARRLLSLINDIIRLSQMDSPTAEMNFEVFDAAQVAQDVIEQLRMGARQMDVSLQLEGASAFIEADRRMVEELIYNLCDNAIRYNVRGGRVVMDVHPEGEKAVIRVCDTGIGISEENQDRVFERFYRVDKSRSKATGGTGLGLAIVKGILNLHNAKYGVESEEGKGSDFWFEMETVRKPGSKRTDSNTLSMPPITEETENQNNG